MSDYDVALSLKAACGIRSPVLVYNIRPCSFLDVSSFRNSSNRHTEMHSCYAAIVFGRPESIVSPRQARDDQLFGFCCSSYGIERRL
jgi:hypothetical protein